MNKHKPFDPVVVRETQERMQAQGRSALLGDRAASALLWFNEFAWDQPPDKVLTIRAEPVARSTPNAEVASKYIAEAAAELAGLVLDNAIARANRDIDLARRALKETSK